MNSKRYQIIFSTRLNALVVVGERCTRSGKSVSESGVAGAHVSQFAPITRFFGLLTLGLALVTRAFADPLANLPVGGAVAQGAVTINQSANAMVIHQDASKAIVNWQSFDIAAAASVNVIQPSSDSVLLNRVVGNNPSQILGSLNANGQVILINPNGILFGKDGSVNANAFIASTLDMRDADFMTGNYRYFSTGVNGEILNHGGINTQQYVALLGAKVTNDGAINTRGGNVYLGAAEVITVPISNSGRIKMELSPASINTAVENTQNGVIVTQGGQVYIQASSLNDAVASLSNGGQINTTAAQAGSVSLLADAGIIKVSGSINANSIFPANKGGSIIIGRDIQTGALSKSTDVSGASLSTNKGFIETSAHELKVDGVKVSAANWLLDPDNIDITGDAVAATAGYSKIKAFDIATALNAGTNVTVATTAANRVGQPAYKDTAGSGAGSAVTGDGNILVSAAIVKSGANNASLTLKADNGITVNQRIGKASGDTTSTGKLDVTMTASGNAATVTNRSGLTLNSVIDAGDGNVSLTGTNSNTNGGSRGVNFNNGSGITANTITVTGTATGSAEWNQGVLFSGTSSFKATGTGSSVISGMSSSTTGAFTAAVIFNDGSNVTLDGGTGSLTVQGSHTATGYSGIRFGANGGSSTNPSLTTRGNVTLGTQDSSNASLNAGFFVRGGLITADTGSLTIKGQATGHAVTFFDGFGTIKSNGGSIALNGVATTSGRGVYLVGNSVGTLNSGADVSITGTSAGGYAGVQFDGGNVRVYGKNVTINGTANTASGQTGYGFYSVLGPFIGNTITAAGNLSINGTVNGAGSGTAITHVATSWQKLVNAYTAGGTLSITGTNNASAANTSATITMAGVQAKAGGDLTVSATTNNAATDAISIWSSTYYAPPSPAPGYIGGASSFESTGGNTTLKSNQGSIIFQDGVPNSVTSTAIKGKNVIIDNTGGTFAGGVFTAGTGVSTSASRAGVQISDGLQATDPNLASNPTLRTITATDASGQIILSGKKAVTTGSGVEIKSAAALSAANITILGENTGATGAAINISSAAATLTSSQATTLTAGGVGSVTSLVAAGNISVGTQLKVTTPAAGTISGLISGAGSLLKMGAGQTKLTAYNGTTYGTNTFTGGTTISQGSILLGNGNGSYNKTAGAGAITLGDTNTGNSDVGLWIEKGTNGSQASLSRAITVSSYGTGTATIGGANGTGSGWTIITGTIDLNRNVTFADMTNDRLGLDGQITGTGNITIAGSGSGGGPRVSMGTAKTFTGDVTINAGVQLQASAANLFKSTTNVLANGTFNLNGTSQAINSLNGNSTGQVTSGGTLTVGSNNGGGAFAGVISGGTKLIKNGSGTQLLTGNNTYTGGTNVVAGTLQIGDGTNNGLIGAGAVDIATGATLDFNVKSSGANYGTSNTFTGGGTFKKTGAGGLTWGGGIANFSLGAGALIDVQQGILTGAANANDVWTSNKASLNVAGGAVFAGVEGNIMVDALTGAGAVTSGFPGYAYGLTVGVNGGGGTFSGSIQNANGASAKLTKTGAGTQILTGNNTYTGTTTISAGVLQVGNGGTAGSLGTGAVIDNASLVFIRSDSLTIANAISGTGALTQSGTGTTILTANNSYTGTTTISGGTLQVGNAGTTGTLGLGDVTLSNSTNLNYVRSAATTIANNISGLGNVSATITGTSSNLTVDHTINLTGGSVNLVTDADLLLSKAISTSDTTSSAILLNAGKATAAGASAGGDVKISGNGALTVGSGGRATIMTGSVAGSTGLGIVAGNSRFNSDEIASNYTTPLGAGTYAIYREAPTLIAAVNNSSKTYDGQSYSGGYTTGLLTGFVNGDTNAQLGTVIYGGSSQTAVNADNYVISASATSGVGYNVSYSSGTLAIGKANLTLSGTRVYDATQIFAGQYLIATGVNNETFAVTGVGDISNLGTKNVQSGQALSSLTGLALGTSGNGGLSTNYNALSTTGSSVSVTTKLATVNATATNLTYNGLTQNQTTETTSGFIVGDAISISGQASGKNAATYTSVLSVGGADASNYNISVTNADLVIAKANLTVSGSRVYDGNTSFAGGNLTATGVAGETFTMVGSGDATNLISKNVQTNQSLSSVTGLSLGSGGSGALSANYNSLSVTGSSVSVTPKTLNGNLIGVAQKIYDGNVNAALTDSNFNLSGWVTGEAATVTQTSGTYASKNVSDNGGFSGSGTFGNVTATLSVDQLSGTNGTDVRNYIVPNSVSGVIGKITPATLNIKVNDTKIFVTQDANNAKDMGYTFTGLVNGEDASNVLSPLVRSYTGANAFPLAGPYIGVYGLASTPTAVNDNYSISLTTGNLKVAAADKLLVAVSSQADTYGNRVVSTAAVAGTGTVTAQYCLDQNNCTGSNLVDLTMTSNGGIDWTATDRSGGTIALSTLIPTTGNLSSGGYLKAGNYTYSVGSITSSSQFNGTEVTGGTLTINKLSITPTASAISRAYDGSNLVSGMTLGASQVKAGDIVTASTAGGTFANQNVQTNTSVTYTGLNLTSTDSANYSLAVNAVTGAGSIMPKTVSLSATKVYDSSTDMIGKVTINTGIAGETLNYTGATVNDEDVLDAHYINAITLTNGTNGLATNYQTASLTQSTAGLNTATVTPKAASVTATATNLTYNGATQNQTAQTSSGFISGDDITFSGIASGKNAGSYASNLVINGTDASNYNATMTNANLVISTASLTVTGTNNNATYSGVAQANSGASISGTQGSDSFTISGYGSGTHASATAYADTLSLTAGASTLLNNYTINYINGGLTIGKANLSAAGTMVYDATTDFAGTRLTSIVGVNGETFTASGAGALANANVQTNQQLSSVSGLTLTGVSGALTSNYNALSAAQTSVSVTPRSLTVTGANNAVTYNGGSQTNIGASYAGNQGSDSFTISGYGTGTNAGTYTDSLSVASVGSTLLSNYSINYINRGLTINKAVIVATGNSMTGTYSGNNQSVEGFTISGLQGSDSSTNLSSIVALGATGKNSGAYSNMVTAGVETNYIVTTVNGSLIIDKANLILSGTRIYDAGTTFAGQYLTATGVNNETFAVTGVGDSSNLVSKVVQTGSLNSVTGLAVGSSSNGGLGSNYNQLSAAGSSISVTPKALTMIIAASEKVYDGAMSATVLKSSSDVIGLDSVTLINNSASFSDKNVSRDANGYVVAKTVTATGLGIGGIDATNYTLQNTTATTTAKITPKGLKVSGLTASAKTYDGNVNASVSVSSASFEGLVANDALTVVSTGVFNDKNAANNKTVTLVSTYGGADVGNYTISDQATTQASITPKLLSGSLIGTTEKVYDGLQNANLGASNFSLTDWVGTEGEGSSVTQTAGMYSNKNVSANAGAGAGAVSANLAASHITVGAGTLMSNYAVPTTLSGNIGKITSAPLNIKVNDTQIFVTQNANNAFDNGFSYTGLVNGESALVALGAELTRSYEGNLTTPQVGNYTAVYGLVGNPISVNGNYNITLTKGNLIVNAVGKLLLNIQSGSDVYGNRDINNAMKATNVTAEYCFNPSISCVGSNLVSLSMSTSDYIHWTATDNTNNQITLLSSISDGSFSSGGYLKFGNYLYSANNINSTNANQFSATAINGGVLTINKLMITPTADDVSRTYNASTLVDGMALNTLQMMAGDSLNAITAGGSFANKDVQSNTSVTYNNITLGGSDADNYALSLNSNGGLTGQGSITPKTVSLSATKVYDGNDDMTGKVLVDTGIAGESLTYTSATVNDKNVNGARFISAIQLADGSGLASNYSAPSSAGSNNEAAVTKAALNASLQGVVQKTYDGNTIATLSDNNFDLQGWVVGEGATVTQTTGAYNSQNVIDNRGLGAVSTALSASDWSARSGTVLSNYVLPLNATGNVGLIDKKAVTLSSINANSKTYDGTDTAVITSGNMTTGVGSETLLVSGTGRFDTKNAGLAKTVTANVADLIKANGTGDWANYNLTTTGNIATTADIGKKVLTLSSISAADKKYDGKISATVTFGSLLGLVGNEQLLASASGTFVDAEVGANKLVLVSMLLADGLSGDLANNYTLSFANPFASIGKDNTPLINPVSSQPLISPSQSGGSSSKIGNQQFTAEVVKPEVVAKQCSVENPESCGCQNTLVEGVSLCMAPSNDATANESENTNLKLSKK